MPMVIACLRASGIEFMIISRRPVTTSSMMTTPYITHMPMACGQVITGTTCEDSTPETDRPAASASGTLPKKPISSVVKAAANAVAVMSAFWPSVSPAASLPDRIRGLSRRMYAIAMKVVTPPRSSRATEDPLRDMWKYRSSQDLPAGTRVPSPASSAVVLGSTDCWVMGHLPRFKGTPAVAVGDARDLGRCTTRGTARDEQAGGAGDEAPGKLRGS